MGDLWSSGCGHCQRRFLGNAPPLPWGHSFAWLTHLRSIAITSFLRVTGRTLFAAVPGENVQRQADQQRHIDAKHLGLGSAAHKTFHAGFIDRKNLFQKNHGRSFKRPQRFSMPKPAQSLSSIRRRSTAGNSLRSMRPTLNCTGLHKRKCALCWAGRSSLKWMC